MSRLRRMLRSDQGGFTIVELLVASTLGIIILGSATMITIGAGRHNNEVANRTDATQRGRLAMERMQRLIRSQVCTSAVDAPVTDARRDSITFTADLSDGTRPVERHTFTYDAGNFRLTDARWLGSGSPVTFPGAARTEVLATDVVRQGTSPIFRYYAYPNPLPSSGVVEPSVELVPTATGSLPTDTLVRIARVDITFATRGATRSTQKIRAAQTNQVFVRLADPDSGSADPSCA